MARETSAERRTRQEREQAEYQALAWKEFTAQYPVRFANVLFRYMNLGYASFRVVRVDATTFRFARTNRVMTLPVTPPSEYSREVVESMQDAELELQFYDEEVAEEKRKTEARATALSKLTTEERTLLGL